MIKVKADPAGSVSVTPKGFIRQFIMLTPDGRKHVKKVFSKDRSKIEGDGVREMDIEPGEMVFLAQ